MQHCPSYFNNTYTYNSSSSSYSLCSSHYTSSSSSSSSENTTVQKTLSSSYRLPSCNRIITIICLPIHSPPTPVHLTFPNKSDPPKVSLIQEILMNKNSYNSPTSSSTSIHIRQTTTSENSISSNLL